MSDRVQTFRFHFTAHIGQFILNASNISSPLVVNWKRSSESVSTTSVDIVGGKACIDQTITLPVNMYFQTANQIFQDKKSIFTFNMTTPKGEKQAGIVHVELAQILNNKLDSLQQYFMLEKCPIKDSKVFITIKAQYIGQNTSDVFSVDSNLLKNSGPSTLSIESKKTMEKKEDSTIKIQKETSKVVQRSRGDEKDKTIGLLEKEVQTLKRQKQQLSKALRQSQSGNGEQNLRQELLKSKAIQNKLQTELNNIRSENIEHERQLEKMRVKMEQIYQVLLANLNSLY